MPEAVLCGTKTVAQVVAIVDELAAATEPRLLTRLTDDQLTALAPTVVERLDDDRLSRTAMLNGTLPRRPGRVVVVAAGTSDASVASEAARTLTFSGVQCQTIVDVGVAGLWRLEARLDEIREADIVIAVAGMDAALVSVLGGLVRGPGDRRPDVGRLRRRNGGHRSAPQFARQLCAGRDGGQHRQRFRRGVRRGADALAARWVGRVTIGWIDGTAGASGDMLLGALVDAGVPFDEMQAQIDRLGLDITLRTESVVRGGLGATKVHVDVPASDAARHLPEIVALLQRLDEPTRRRSVAVFERLARAEAAVHRTSLDAVHFHEVGALDSIADVVGVCAGFVALGLDALHCSTLSLGSGTTRGAHGPIPVPAPAVLAVLTGIGHVAAGPAPYESTTPTGAAILAEWVDVWGVLPEMNSRAVGMGAGTKDTDAVANVCRIVLGEPLAGPETIVQIDTNVDDMDPRVWPEVIAAVLAAGALDAWITPIVMKKGRPAHTFSALCSRSVTDAVRSTIFRETTTIGVREYPVDREVLERVESTIDLDGDDIRVKTASRNGEILHRSVEWDDVVAAARRTGRPPNDVLVEATARLARHP